MSVDDGASPLKNPRHEKLAQLVTSGKSMPEAMREGGFSESSVKTACRYEKMPHIRARIDYLSQQAASKAVVTAADIALQLDEDRTFAREQGHSAAAVSATMGKAKVLGLIIDKSQIGVKRANRRLALARTASRSSSMG